MSGDEGAQPQAALETVLEHRFNRPDLLRAALTHPSAAPKSRDGAEHYERLEFLGDRVLALVMAELLLAQFPAENEGELTRRLMALVRRETVLQVARGIDLGRFMQMAASPAARPDLARDTVLADGCEALIGALYLDAGLEVAGRFVRRQWEPLMRAALAPPRDAKTALQEWAQGRGLPLPSYGMLGRTGPAHQPIFTVEVQLPGIPSAQGSGSSKRAAEQTAARLLLDRLESDG